MNPSNGSRPPCSQQRSSFCRFRPPNYRKPTPSRQSCSSKFRPTAKAWASTTPAMAIFPGTKRSRSSRSTASISRGPKPGAERPQDPGRRHAPGLRRQPARRVASTRRRQDARAAPSKACDGKPLRGPNDLTLDTPNGGFYFTDPAAVATPEPIGTLHYVDKRARRHLLDRVSPFPTASCCRPMARQY